MLLSLMLLSLMLLSAEIFWHGYSELWFYCMLCTVLNEAMGRDRETQVTSDLLQHKWRVSWSD